MKETYNKTFSIMKGIAIISVVVGHVFVRTGIEESVNQYHLAVFFFVAGYFFKDKNIHAPINFIMKKIKTLYIPFIILCSLFLFLHNFFTHFHICTGLLSTKDLFQGLLNIIIKFNSNEELMGAMWFCPMLLIVSILALIQKKIQFYLFKRYMIIQHFILFFIGSFILYILHLKSPYCILQNMIITGIFFSRYLFNKYEYYINTNNKQNL